MRLLLTTLLALVWVAAEACSSAVVARSASKEGGVILWKHRDQTSINDCRIAHFDDGRYAYTALVNSYVSVGTSALAGVNEVGFGCISTATNHLSRKPAVVQRPDSRYNLMATALRECRTVDEFEQLLKRFKRGASFESNIGVGDAEGGAAYFEIWADGYRSYDVEQYDVRTNFSFAALNSDRGASERRYRTVHAQMKDEKMFSTADFIGYSRSFYSADKGDILADDKPYRDNNYTVPRRSSVASVAIVCSTTPRMDVIIGHPVAGISVPVWVAAGRNIPKCVAGRAMYDLGRAFTAKAYYTDGKRAYLNKNIARKALKINNDIKTPKRMPSDIVKFNAKIDAIFEKHRHQMLQAL
ncbi:MAG: hypothetical protein IJX65_07835 [Alistipes sp.]|nr:hypothetical protein [Alistipes sp.]